MTVPYCMAPFGHITQHAEGIISPCCAWTKDADELQNKTLEQAFSTDYMVNLRERMLRHDVPENCVKCVKREQHSNSSNRIEFNNQTWPEDIVENPRIVNLDVSFSNYCNLKCRMCHSGLSTSWASDQKKIQHLPYVTPQPTEHINNPPIDIDLLKQVKVFHFKGGEPLLDPQFKRFIENVDLSDAQLKLTTNGTFFNKDVFERIAQAHSGHVNISIDAVDDALYRYIRGGRYGIAHTESVVKNIIDVFKQNNSNMKIFLNYTMQAYNLFEYRNIVDWWNKFDYVRPAQEVDIVINYPKYLRVNVIPLWFRKAIADELYTDYPKLYEFVTQNEESGLEDFVDYTQQLDSIRGENLLDIEPRFTELFT